MNLFVSNYDGKLFQWSWKDCIRPDKPKKWDWGARCLLKNYGPICEDSNINALCCTPDSKFLFVTDSKGSLLMYGIPQQKLLKDFSSKVEPETEIKKIYCSWKTYPQMGQSLSSWVKDFLLVD